MSNDNVYERLFKQQAMIGKFVLDGTRDPNKVASILQGIIDEVQTPVQKFALLADLDIITVPRDYVHKTRLDSFMKQNRKKFYDVNNNITDANFSNPSRILKPGDKLWVRAFEQVVSGTTTTKERMDFCRQQPTNHWVGAQGNSLVFDQKRDQLPKGKWYESFDEEDRLWEDTHGYRRVSYLDAYSDGDFDWYLGHFGPPWNVSLAFFCFCDPPQTLVA